MFSRIIKRTINLFAIKISKLFSKLIMELKVTRKYNTESRKKIISKIDRLKNKSDYVNIYNIIIEDIGNIFSSNRNGLFINLNLVSDDCINKLLEFLEDKFNYSISQTDTDKVNYTFYKADDMEMITKIGHKLSNQEKNIIKRSRNKIF